MNEEFGLVTDNINKINLDNVENNYIDIDSFFKSDNENNLNIIKINSNIKKNDNSFQENKDFINKVTFSFKSPIYIYTILTCGDNIGQALELFKKELDKKRLQISSAYSLIMPESYVCLPFMNTDTPENELNKIHKATIELTRIANEIISRESGIVRINTGKFPWILSHVIGAYFNAFMISDKKFFVDENICIHCRKCEKTCPTGNIFIKNGLPHWHHNNICTNCLSCYHHCPKHAINYGKITRKRGQYFFGHTTNNH